VRSSNNYYYETSRQKGTSMHHRKSFTLQVVRLRCRNPFGFLTATPMPKHVLNKSLNSNYSVISLDLPISCRLALTLLFSCHLRSIHFAGHEDCQSSTTSSSRLATAALHMHVGLNSPFRLKEPGRAPEITPPLERTSSILVKSCLVTRL